MENQEEGDKFLRLRSGRQITQVQTQELIHILSEFGTRQNKAIDSSSVSSSSTNSTRESAESNSFSNLPADQEFAFEQLRLLFYSETNYLNNNMAATEIF